MANIDFQKVISTLKDSIINLAESTFKNYKNEAKSDGLALLNSVKENLETWTQELADGKLSKEDFEFLILGQKELIEMNALKQAGLSLINVDEFKTSVLHLIVNTVFGLL